MTGEPRDPKKSQQPIDRIIALQESDFSEDIRTDAANLLQEVKEGEGEGRNEEEKFLDRVDKVCRILLLRLQEPGEHVRQTCEDLIEFYSHLVSAGLPFQEASINEHILEHLVWQIHQDPSFPIDYEQCRQLKQAIEKASGATLKVEIPEGPLMPELERLATATELEEKESYVSSLDRGIEALRGSEGIVELEHPELPTIVISDIHGRRDYLLDRLRQPMNLGESVYELLQQGRTNIVCLGDGLHVEAKNLLTPKYNREQDLLQSLGAMKMVMELKAAFPEHFHYVRGNHDNITDEGMSKSGACQSEIFLAEAKSRFGEDFIAKYQEWEQSLPLLVVAGHAGVISHAAPAKVLSREAISGRSEAAFFALAWTDNNEDPAPAEQALMPDSELVQKVKNDGMTLGTSPEIIQQTLKNLDLPDNTPWIIGHRPVRAGAQVQWDQLVQVHNSGMQMWALMRPFKKGDSRYVPSQRTSSAYQEYYLVDSAGKPQVYNGDYPIPL